MTENNAGSPDALASLSDLDPKQLDSDAFIRLLETASQAADGDRGADLSTMTPEAFARLISRASRKQVEAVMARPELRSRILGEIFRRMREHFRSDRAPAGETVVHWKITGPGKNDEADRYETVISDGALTVHSGEQHEQARCTIVVGPVEFLKLASGNASPPVLFMSGKIKVRGDLAFAAGMAGLFRIPSA